MLNNLQGIPNKETSDSSSGIQPEIQIQLWCPWHCGISLGLPHVIPILRFHHMQKLQLQQPGHPARGHHGIVLPVTT